MYNGQKRRTDGRQRTICQPGIATDRPTQPVLHELFAYLAAFVIIPTTDAPIERQEGAGGGGATNSAHPLYGHLRVLSPNQSVSGVWYSGRPTIRKCFSSSRVTAIRAAVYVGDLMLLLLLLLPSSAHEDFDGYRRSDRTIKGGTYLMVFMLFGMSLPQVLTKLYIHVLSAQCRHHVDASPASAVTQKYTARNQVICR